MTSPTRLLQDVLIQSSRERPNHVAIVSGGVRLNYREVADHANRMAWLLRDRGVERGDRVIVFMDNNWRCACAVLGVLAAGGVVVLVNAQTKRDKLAYIVSDAIAKVVIHESSLSAVVEPVADELASVRYLVTGDVDVRRSGSNSEWIDEVLQEFPTEMLPQSAITLDLAVLIYTSGTTGHPKGVMHTHQSLLFALESINEYLQIGTEDRIFSALPLSFGYGLFQWLSTLRAGAMLVLERSFTYPAVAFRLMRDEAVTIFPSVPTVFSMLVSQHAKQPLSFDTVRVVTNAAAALPNEFIPRLEEIFPNGRLYKMHGQTECIRTAYLDPSLARVKQGSVGKAMPGTELMVLDEHLRPVQQGEVGTLYVRGPNVMKGYWRQPEKTAEVLVKWGPNSDLILNTGDLFYRDGDGDLYFVSRSDDVIKSRGEKVSPAEVEQVLYCMSQVREAVVVGIPDELLGEAVCVFVVVRDGQTLSVQEVKRRCAEKLEGFMVPKHVVFLESLPVTENGKLSRKLIVERCSGLIRSSADWRVRGDGDGGTTCVNAAN